MSNSRGKMNDLSNKMILDGYKSLSDKIDDLEHSIHILFDRHDYQTRAMVDMRDDIIMSNERINDILETECYEVDENSFYYTDDDYECVEIRDLIFHIRKMINETDMTLDDILTEIVENM